jgi:N-acetyl-gamma-glutamyl-phosphate reductase
MIQAGIVGATGYAGLELARILYNHPSAAIQKLGSVSRAGETVGSLYPHTKALADRVYEEMDPAAWGKDCDVIFTCLPHEASAEMVARLKPYGKPVIDFSGAYRYDDPAVYARSYGAHPHPELLPQAVYGLTELYREQVKHAKIVANPGCFTTCSILALTPVIAAGLIDIENIVIDAKTGVSGAGRSPSQDLHFCEVHDNFKAYKVAAHRHTSEIEQELSKAAGKPLVLSFTPHLLPVKRGILETIYCTLPHDAGHGDIMAAYKKYYGNEPFITLYGEGKLPELKHVVGANDLHIGWVVDKRLNRLIIIAALDNLVKGAAGQAVQNMNVLFDRPETEGLESLAWYL